MDQVKIPVSCCLLWRRPSTPQKQPRSCHSVPRNGQPTVLLLASWVINLSPEQTQPSSSRASLLTRKKVATYHDLSKKNKILRALFLLSSFSLLGHQHPLHFFTSAIIIFAFILMHSSFPSQSFLLCISSIQIFHIYTVVCLTTGPKPLPKRALHIVRSRASSFKYEYPLLSLRTSNSFLRLLPCLPVTSIPPCIFPSVTRCRRQFLRKMWPVQFAFRLHILLEHCSEHIMCNILFFSFFFLFGFWFLRYTVLFMYFYCILYFISKAVP